MLISCIAFTNGCSDWQIKNAMDSYHKQSHVNKQLIIVNNHHDLKKCLEFRPLFHDEVCIIDRPGFSNASALLEAATMASGQLVAHYPFDFYHHKDRLSESYNHIVEYNADLVSPPGYNVLSSDNLKSEFIHQTYTVGELCVYKRPVFRYELDIEYGVWWQYLLLAHKHGQQIISIENTNLALKIPYAEPTNFNLSEHS